ncbi:MAG: RNA 2'-phosphotransferase, partial [Maritimibacter sp.]|nr:RNA 2'-phosphotransferase [Maritimibacter sp.]
DEIDRIVATNPKQRFALSPDGTRIRARQGHSLAVDLGLAPVTPPQWLYHGTARNDLDAIRAEGLKPGARQHVHLSPDPEIAHAVGARHGAPVVLIVAAGALAAAGHLFYLSENGVWLTDRVPPGYVTAPET